MVPLIFRPLALAAAVLAGIAGTAAAQSVSRGQYNASPPTLSNGALGNMQLDANGNLKITGSGSGGAITVTTAPQTGTGGQNAVTVTNSSASILAARTAPKYALSIKNESTTASIAFCFGSSCTAALNTAGSITLTPGQLYSESPAFIHLDQINGISSAATSPATIQSN